MGVNIGFVLDRLKTEYTLTFFGSRGSGVEAELLSADSSSERSLVTSRGKFSVSMLAGKPSLSQREVGVDSSGILRNSTELQETRVLA